MHVRLRKELSLLTTLAAFIAFRRHRDKTAAGLLSASAAIRFLPWGPRYSFSNRHVLITGGSRGLGLALAYRLAAQKAKITLLARDSAELKRAEDLVREKYPATQIACVSCDVTHDMDLFTALREAHQRQGSFDVVINNAGSIAVAPFACIERADFAAQMDLHLNAVINMTREIAKYFKARGGGRIVNISSIGGKIAVPHMSAYSASKFALSGFSRAMASELIQDGIFVTTVYPGLMRTGSPIQAVFKGDQEKEFAWFAASDLTPGLSMPPDRAARKILEACRSGDVEVVLSWPAQLGVFANDNFPELTGVLLKAVSRLLPQGNSLQRKTGAASESWFNRQTWALPLRRIEEKAQQRFNQVPKFDADFNLGL